MKLRFVTIGFIATLAMANEATFPPPERKAAIEALRADGPVLIDGRLDEVAAEAASFFMRLSWEYRPLSYIHLVINDRAALDRGGLIAEFPRERQLILKFSFLRQL